MYVEISEHDASGNRVKHVGYFYAYYYLVGNTCKFITNPTNSGNGAYVKKESLATLPNNVVKIDLEELVGYNGVFSIAHVEYTYTNTNTYVEIDGTYYYYNDYRHAYMSEYDALRFFGDLEWKYVAWNPQDANYYLCELVSIDKYVTITNIGNIVYNIYDQGEVKEIGLTKDKWIVYETSLFSWPSDLTTETRPDGTVFYSRNGENHGVLKTPDGKYFEAEKVMMNDGTTKIVPINLGRAELYVNSDVIFDHLKSYITFSSGNMVVTFSPDLLTAMEKLFGRSVYDIGLEFCFRSESEMQYHLSLYELAEYFGYSRGNNDKYDKYEK